MTFLIIMLCLRKCLDSLTNRSADGLGSKKRCLWRRRWRNGSREISPKGSSGHLTPSFLLNIDPTGQGVSESAVLNNEEARALYEQHRSWKGSPRRTTNTTKKVKVPRISAKVDRDHEQVRQRYPRLRKAGLVDRLLAVEVACVKQEQRWLEQQDENFTWQLRAEAAETRLTATRIREVSAQADESKAQ